LKLLKDFVASLGTPTCGASNNSNQYLLETMNEASGCVLIFLVSSFDQAKALI